ncbi:protein of unknown function [Modestobacter italicus]|uniref:Uncharacterized protein n=1 Tax=Modestobacter italicus (strain DSM 44449 / CECT 9708 / BC 501) TaxID=2732864 RepID=I4F4U4_MODI5|nr:protein of unknown function [Modestobacter marinus]
MTARRGNLPVRNRLWAIEGRSAVGWRAGCVLDGPQPRRESPGGNPRRSPWQSSPAPTSSRPPAPRPTTW